MKNLYLIIFIFTFSSIFSIDKPKVYVEASIGNVAFINNFKIPEPELAITTDIIQLGLIEPNTGLGLTTYIASFDLLNEKLDSDLFPLELSWQPFFSKYDYWNAKLFFRAENYLQVTDSFNFKTGFRFDLKIDLDKFQYPYLSFETGYNYKNGYYLGAKIDPILLTIVAGYLVGATATSDVYEDSDMPEDFGPKIFPDED